MKPTKPLNTPQEVISVRHLWAGYDGETILEDINLSVEKLDFIGLVGPNGGGKTTLFKVLLGLLPPTRGEVQIMGQSVKITSDVVEIAKKSAPASAYTIPADYKKTDKLSMKGMGR